MKNKILLVRNDNIGDLVCTTPAIEAFRKKYPDAKIDIVVNSYNDFVIKNNPFLDTIYTYTKSKHVKGISNKLKALFGKIGIMSKIFFTKYDVAVVFRSGYSSSAEQFSNLSRAKQRIGVKGKNDNFTHHINLNPNEHEVEFCFRCLEPLDVKYNNEKLYFYLDDSYIQKYKNLKNKITFHISSRKINNKMSFEKLKDIFINLDENINITAEPADFEMAKELEKLDNVEWIKTKTFFDLAGVIKNSKLFITLDGGAMHIAPAIGVKTISLMGETNINKWYPWGYKELVLQDKTKKAENINNRLIIKRIKENV